MKRYSIAIVNQRYGTEINGGSEQYTRMIAERLQKYFDVEVLTSCALDYDTWKDYYSEGIEEINGVKVRRFGVKKERNVKFFNIINCIAFRLKFGRALIEKLWVKEQGPYVLRLKRYLTKNENKYKAIIFVTYLYYTTVGILPNVNKKSILIPTAHDEPYIYYRTYRKVFEKAKGIIYLTNAEKRFVENIFDVTKKKNEVIAVGMEIPTKTSPDRFCAKYHIQGPYVIYVGRVDLGKNCEEMFQMFIKYKRNNPGNLKLVVLGKSMMPIPQDEDIISLGFVSDEDKYNGIAGAKGLIMPSKYESLSLVVLEAMALSVPVIVNGECEVLKEHCINSNAGKSYSCYKEFEEILLSFEEESEEYLRMKKNGLQYVEDNYMWQSVEKRLVEFIDDMIEG